MLLNYRMVRGGGNSLRELKIKRFRPFLFTSKDGITMWALRVRCKGIDTKTRKATISRPTGWDRDDLTIYDSNFKNHSAPGATRDHLFPLAISRAHARASGTSAAHSAG